MEVLPAAGCLPQASPAEPATTIAGAPATSLPKLTLPRLFSLFSIPLCVFASWREIPAPHDIHSQTFPITHSASITVHVSCFGDPLRPDALSPSRAQRIVDTVNFARPLAELRRGRSDR